MCTYKKRHLTDRFDVFFLDFRIFDDTTTIMKKKIETKF